MVLVLSEHCYNGAHQHHHQQHLHQPLHHHHPKRKNHQHHRLTSAASACVILTGCMAWFSVWNVGKQLLVLDPRQLTAKTYESSSSYRSAFKTENHVATPNESHGTLLLLHNTNQDSLVATSSSVLDSVLVEVASFNLTQAESSSMTLHWNRLVFLEGEASWYGSLDADEEIMQKPNTGGRVQYPTYPRIIPPLGERGVYEDDDVGPKSMEDFTRWYPQIDSADERFHMERKAWPRHEIDPVHCHPMYEWQSTSFPICNTIHEKDMLFDSIVQNMQSITRKGFWRHAWKSMDTPVPQEEARKTVWKTFKIHHSMEDAFFENNRVDALAMERLTGSPHVIDIYGFCAMTIIQEFAGQQISDQKMNTTESLDLAIQVARGIRDIHYIGGSERPTMVHNDINLANILVTDDGRPVLNDFNIAVLLMENRTLPDEPSVCPFYALFPNPQWRSPEEQVESEEESKRNSPIVNEKIDIYAMGNVLYRLVAGGSPWKIKGRPKLSPEEKMHVARLKRYNGTMPTIPATVRLDDDPVTAILYKAMEMCYAFQPEDRPSAKELVHFLETSKLALVKMSNE